LVSLRAFDALQLRDLVGVRVERIQRSDNRGGVRGPTAEGPGSPLALRPQRFKRGPAGGEVLRDARLRWIVSGRSSDLGDSELDVGQDAGNQFGSELLARALTGRDPSAQDQLLRVVESPAQVRDGLLIGDVALVGVCR
jgi:hypothetical protein